MREFPGGFPNPYPERDGAYWEIQGCPGAPSTCTDRSHRHSDAWAWDEEQQQYKRAKPPWTGLRPAEEQFDTLRRRRGEGMYTPLRAMLTDEARQRLAQASRCMYCGTSMTGAEWDLVRHAQAMNAALRMVRFIAEADARDGMVPVAVILQALDQPYRFPLPDGGDLRADAEAL